MILNGMKWDETIEDEMDLKNHPVDNFNPVAKHRDSAYTLQTN